jgi:hypothetical protein
MADDFNDNLLHPLMWVESTPSSPTMVAEQNSRIEVTPQPNTAGYNGLELGGTLDFRDKTLQVEVQPASQAGAVYTYFKLYLDDNNHFIISSGAGSFFCDATVNGVLDRTLLSWDTTIRYWRFRHDADADTVSFDTSADGTTWTARKTVVAGFPLNALGAGFGAGATGTTNAAPGVAVFDNFRLERYQPLFPQSDNFNDNLRAAMWNINGTSGVSVVEQNGQLQITPPASATGSDGYFSNTKIDLTDARATVELVQSAGSATGVESSFKLFDPATGYYMLFKVGGGVITVEGRTAFGTIRSSPVYSPLQHRFLRFRHNQANDTMALEFSADGRSYPKTALTLGMSTTPVKHWQIQLYAGKTTATATAGTAIFDNLRIERNEGGKAR